MRGIGVSYKGKESEILGGDVQYKIKSTRVGKRIGERETGEKELETGERSWKLEK